MEVGFPVFIRRGRKLSLTDQGSKFYSAAVRFLSAEDELSGFAKRLRQDQTDYIRIISAPFLANAFINEAVARIVHRYDRLSIAVDSHARIDAEAVLAEGKFDFAIISLPLISGDYNVVPFLRVHPVIAMNSQHTLTDLDIVTFKDLNRHELITTHPRSSLHRHLIDLADAAGESIRSRIEAKNGIIACQLAGEPVGCCLADPFMALSCGAKDLVIRPFRTDKFLEYGFVLPKRQVRTEIMDTLIMDIRRTTQKRIEEHGLQARLLGAQVSGLTDLPSETSGG